jgi:hypothetical protein
VPEEISEGRDPHVPEKHELPCHGNLYAEPEPHPEARTVIEGTKNQDRQDPEGNRRGERRHAEDAGRPHESRAYREPADQRYGSFVTLTLIRQVHQPESRRKSREELYQ